MKKYYVAFDCPVHYGLEYALGGKTVPSTNCVDVTKHPLTHSLTPKRRRLIMQSVCRDYRATCAVFIEIEDGKAKAVDEYLDEMRVIYGV